MSIYILIRGGRPMDDDFEKLMKKFELYQKSHTKCVFEDRRRKIKETLANLRKELEGEADITLVEKSDNIEILITGKSFLTCTDGAHGLNELIGGANYFEANIIDGNIVFLLWFRLWDWV